MKNMQIYQPKGCLKRYVIAIKKQRKNQFIRVSKIIFITETPICVED